MSVPTGGGAWRRIKVSINREKKIRGQRKRVIVRGTEKKKNRLHWPGIEPGPPAWQARILPLNHQCHPHQRFRCIACQCKAHYLFPRVEFDTSGFLRAACLCWERKDTWDESLSLLTCWWNLRPWGRVKLTLLRRSNRKPMIQYYYTLTRLYQADRINLSSFSLICLSCSKAFYKELCANSSVCVCVCAHVGMHTCMCMCMHMWVWVCIGEKSFD